MSFSGDLRRAWSTKAIADAHTSVINAMKKGPENENLHGMIGLKGLGHLGQISMGLAELKGMREEQPDWQRKTVEVMRNMQALRGHIEATKGVGNADAIMTHLDLTNLAHALPAETIGREREKLVEAERVRTERAIEARMRGTIQPLEPLSGAQKNRLAGLLSGLRGRARPQR